MDIPEIRYAKSGDVHIAYQVLGGGPIDLVFAPGFVSNIEMGWRLAGRAEFLRSLASHARLIQFDKRGTGMSDPVRDSPTLEVRMDDVRAVMDAAGSERAALLGVDSGGTMSAVFAATYPDRTAGLVLFGTSARTLWAPDHPWGPTEQEHLRTIDRYERFWGTTDLATDILDTYSPSVGPDDDTIRTWATYLRQSASPGTIAAFERMNMLIDVRGVLPAIHVPTLVVHRSADRVVDVRAGRFLADHISGARFVELAGEDHSPFGAGADELVETTGEFLADLQAGGPAPERDRILATILFTDIVGSTARAAELGDARWRDLLERHHAAIRQELARHRGTEVETAGDGFLATFDGPARAIRCATAIVGAVRALGLEIRAGLHTGECEQVGGKLGGIAVHIGARVADAARPGEVLVSGTVKDLVAGSELEFDEQEAAELKGVPGEWRLYAVRR
ncbi:MAG TPA: adenylate/guanylate cyclase domain-containing protein [Gaiellaceae bacterium]|nr:adenylate/guanylate cyclase domain-containing protein [Gaiellaceae bacterium]